MNKLVSAPAHLIIGNPDSTLDYVHELLQHLFCKHNKCMQCNACMQIRQHNHHAVQWLSPSGNTYTVDQFDELLDTISLRLDDEQHFFFVIQQAEVLGLTCSNRLLKPMEEPPPGYHFILLSEQKDRILPTIHSRCIETLLDTEDHNDEHPLFTLLTSNKVSAVEFIQELDRSKINDYESISLLNKLLHHWSHEYTKEPSRHLLHRIECAQNALLTPPMPGSSSLFWKNFYLSLR